MCDYLFFTGFLIFNPFDRVSSRSHWSKAESKKKEPRAVTEFYRVSYARWIQLRWDGVYLVFFTEFLGWFIFGIPFLYRFFFLLLLVDFLLFVSIETTVPVWRKWRWASTATPRVRTCAATSCARPPPRRCRRRRRRRERSSPFSFLFSFFRGFFGFSTDVVEMVPISRPNWICCGSFFCSLTKMFNEIWPSAESWENLDSRRWALWHFALLDWKSKHF